MTIGPVRVIPLGVASPPTVQGVEKRANAARFSIRLYSKSDIDECIELGRQMHGESAYASILFNADVVRELLLIAADNAKYRGFVARSEESKMIGMCLFFTRSYFFSKERYVQDMCSFVVPEWRGSTVFMRMLNLITNWAKEIRATELVIGTTTMVETEKFENMLVRIGMKRVGGVYKINVKEL